MFNAAMSTIKACYERELNRNEDLAGTLVIEVVIEGDGRVHDVTSALTKGTLGETALCAEDVVRAMVFPEPKGGGRVFVSYPFVFSSSLSEASPPKPTPPPKRTKIERPQEPRVSPGLCTEAWERVFGPSASTQTEQPLGLSARAPGVNF